MGRALQGLILTLLLAAPAQAQECEKRQLSVQPYRVPTGVLCNVTEKGMVCFTLEEYKLILEVDHELHTEKQKSEEKDTIISNQALILNQNKLVIESLEKDKEVLDGQVKRLGEKWRKCMDESEGLPWSSLMWGAGTGVVIGIAAGLATYMILSVPERP